MNASEFLYHKQRVIYQLERFYRDSSLTTLKHVATGDSRAVIIIFLDILLQPRSGSRESR